MSVEMIPSSTGAAAGISGVHGGGSPIMEKIAIMANYDLESKKRLARTLAGIPEEGKEQ